MNFVTIDQAWIRYFTSAVKIVGTVIQTSKKSPETPESVTNSFFDLDKSQHNKSIQVLKIGGINVSL